MQQGAVGRNAGSILILRLFFFLRGILFIVEEFYTIKARRKQYA